MTFNLDSLSISKSGYTHYMLKEIHEQPDVVQSTIFQNQRLDFTGVNKVTLIGCGTSYHAAMIAAMLIEKTLRIPASAHIASEFRYANPLIRPDHMVIVISQSGETADTLAALHVAKGARTVGICNVPHSTLAREVGECLFLKAGPEISVCSTKAFTCQLALLLSLVREDLSSLPVLINQILSHSAEIEAMARKYGKYDSALFIGRQEMYPSALEAALKLKEISYINANAYPAGELKHGAIALVNPSMLTVALLGHKETLDKTLSNIEEIRARGGPVLAFAPKRASVNASDVIAMPECPDHLAPIPYAVATQLFAYFVARLRGTDIDQPRNLAKSVTVE